jgi:hypothetical protein
VAYLRVGHGLGGLGQHPRVLVHERVRGDVGVRGHRPDHEDVALLADAAQLVDLAEVDDGLGGGEPQPHDRDQRLPAGQDLDVVGRAEEPQRLVETRRRVVVERCRDHATPPSVPATDCSLLGAGGVV